MLLHTNIVYKEAQMTEGAVAGVAEVVEATVEAPVTENENNE